MASGPEPMDEADDLLAREPAVSQHVTEPDPVPDGPSDHLHGQLDLGPVVFLLPLLEDMAVMRGDMAAAELLRAHAIALALAFLPEQAEVEEHLGHPVCDGHAEALEPEHALMGEVGMHPAYPLDGTSGLLVIGVVKDEAYVPGLVVRADLHAVPELHGHVPHGLSPADLRVVHEPVEDILARLYQGGHGPVPVVAPDILDPETGEQQETLEHRQERIEAVALAPHRDGVPLCHPHGGQYTGEGVHRLGHIRIPEECFDIREKRSDFAYRHGYEYVFVW